MKIRVNLNAETRDGYYIDEKMKKVWNVELDLLAKLSEICKKYDMKFFADAGTLLGAVRHKGFIPWDDDIDVVMFRKDYDKLLKIADKEFEEPYFFQTAYSDNEYIRGHAQLRNSNTTAILESEKNENYKFNQGIFIDIFVLDAVIDDEKKLEKQRKKVEFKRYILKKHFSNESPKSLKGKIFRNVLKVFFALYPYRKFYDSIENDLRSVDVKNYDNVAPLNFIFETQKRIRNKHIYDEVIMLDFEKIKIPAPKRYDEFLKKRYGDYMKPVNISTTHGEVFFDTEKSYKEYLNL